MRRKRKRNPSEKRDYGKFLRWLGEKDIVKFRDKEVQVPGKRIRVDVCGIGIDDKGYLFSYAVEVKRGNVRIDHVAKALTYRSFFTDCFLAVGRNYEFPDAVYDEAKRQGIGLLRYLKGIGVEVVLVAKHFGANKERAEAAQNITYVTCCKRCKKFFWSDDEEVEKINFAVYRDDENVNLCTNCKNDLLLWLGQK